MEPDEATTTTTTLLLPALVVMLAVVMSLEILQHLLLARCTAVALMGVVWSGFLARELQVKAMLGAIVYHGASEFVHEWKLNFPSFTRKGKDRKVILWLLFLVRVFIWGATFAAASSVVDFIPVTTTTGGFSFLYRWRDTVTRSMNMVAVLVVYCEVIEVLVLLYFADQELPYQWRKRVLLWTLSFFIGVCEAFGILSFVARKLLILMSPLGLFGVLIAAMWVSIQLPWHRAPEFVERIAATYLHPQKHQKHQKRPSMLCHSQSEVEVVTEVQRADSSGYRYLDDRDRDQYQQRQFT